MTATPSEAAPSSTPASQPPQLALLPAPQVPAQPCASKPRARNGKIARLTYLLRDMVNRMMFNGAKDSLIVDALAAHGFMVTRRNLSNWRTHGGYQDWCLHQEHALKERLLQDNLLEHLRTHDAGQLAEVGLQTAATAISQFFLQPETREQLARDPDKFNRSLAALCRLAQQINSLQKQRDENAKDLGASHHPERVKRAEEKEVELTRSIYTAAKIAQGPREANLPHRNYFPRPDHDPSEFYSPD